jgi:hypothetical protein
VHFVLVALFVLTLVVLLRVVVAVPAADACVVNGASVVSTCMRSRIAGYESDCAA